ncbi:MAG: hypothetical protein R3317_07135, partial [Burkholderiaceae bacterium]|nr:hypothetical protein [Burkholderiaceae bacterium]
LDGGLLAVKLRRKCVVTGTAPMLRTMRGKVKLRRKCVVTRTLCLAIVGRQAVKLRRKGVVTFSSQFCWF